MLAVRRINKKLSTICFQLSGGGSCKGDSGGPLMHFVSDAEDPHYVQVGVVHGGIGECGSKNFPGIYARGAIQTWSTLALVLNEVAQEHIQVLHPVLNLKF